MKSVFKRRIFDQYFPACELNMERYKVSIRIQSVCEKIPTRKTPNTDTFYAVYLFTVCSRSSHISDELILLTLIYSYIQKKSQISRQIHLFLASFQKLLLSWSRLK